MYTKKKFEGTEIEKVPPHIGSNSFASNVPEQLDAVYTQGDKLALEKEYAEKFAGTSYSLYIKVCIGITLILLAMHFFAKIPYTLVIAAVFAIAVIFFCISVKRKKKLVQSGNYEVYRLRVTEKLWHADVDSDGASYTFYVRCGDDIVIELEKKQYLLTTTHILAFIYPVKTPPFNADFEFFADTYLM